MPTLSRLAIVLLLSGVAGVVVPGAESSKGDQWTTPNLGWSSTRANEGSAIDAANVRGLKVLWRFRLTHSAVQNPNKPSETVRAIVATPIVAGGTIYIQDSTSSVFAIDRATGALRWEHRFRAPNYGRNGLSFSSGSVYGATDTTVFSLSSKTGRLIWQRRLVTATEQYVDIAPLIGNNLVYVSTVGYPPGGRGALYALDAHDGVVRWRFSTILRPWRYPSEAGGGGAWYTPSLDAQGNVYWGIANPYPAGGAPGKPNGGAYPGRALYTDSLIVLDGQTGRLLWYDQVTAHDVRDYDFQLPPILATLNSSGVEQNVVFGAGKAGIVVAWNRDTHRRIWQTAVGKHLNDTGPLPARPVEICPGYLGGVESPPAYEDGTLFVPVVDLCTRGSATSYHPVATLDTSKGTGEFVALDARSGAVSWKRQLPQPDFGCATAARGVVFTATADGHLYGFDTKDGALLWQARAPAGIDGCPALSARMLLVAAGSVNSKIRSPRFELIAYALPRVISATG